ncbi:MAG: hypothetical protein ACPGVO_19530 [Spirulinaceae cyanobacterium]
MLPAVRLLPGSIAEMLAATSQTGVITKADQYGLQAALLEETLSEEELRAVNRLLRGVKRGKITVIESL